MEAASLENPARISRMLTPMEGVHTYQKVGSTRAWHVTRGMWGCIFDNLLYPS